MIDPPQQQLLRLPPVAQSTRHHPDADVQPPTENHHYSGVEQQTVEKCYDREECNRALSRISTTDHDKEAGMLTVWVGQQGTNKRTTFLDLLAGLRAMCPRATHKASAKDPIEILVCRRQLDKVMESGAVYFDRKRTIERRVLEEDDLMQRMVHGELKNNTLRVMFLYPWRRTTSIPPVTLLSRNPCIIFVNDLGNHLSPNGQIRSTVHHHFPPFHHIKKKKKKKFK
jgi:hypothetical protein